MRAPRGRSREQRFWEKVDRRTVDECWEWTAGLDGHGYGSFNLSPKTIQSYRYAWLLLRGSLPDSAVLDHLCRNRKCVNPWHLEPVSIGENLKRSPLTWTTRNMSKTHCIHGHSLDDAYIDGTTGWRKCRTCVRARQRAKRAL